MPRAAHRVRKRAVSAPLLPPYVALLEPLALELSVTRSGGLKRPLYVLQTQRRKTLETNQQAAAEPSDASTCAAWSSSRRFEDYEVLCSRLVAALQHGHFCQAGCPWLHLFLTSYFPKACIFTNPSGRRTAEERRVKLLELLRATLAFVLERQNHSCAVLTTHVAKLLAEFLLGEAGVADQLVESATESEDGSSRRSSVFLSNSDDDCATDTNSARSTTEAAECLVCNAALGSEPGSPAELELESETASPPPTRSRRRSSLYAVTLRCGHQFHDECIVPVLDATLRCPTCHCLEIQ